MLWPHFVDMDVVRPTRGACGVEEDRTRRVWALLVSLSRYECALLESIGPSHVCDNEHLEMIELFEYGASVWWIYELTWTV
jgi:hypothetical protein